MGDAFVSFLSIRKRLLECSCSCLEKVPLLRWTLFVRVTCGAWTRCPALEFKIAEHFFLCPQDNSSPVASHIHPQVNMLWQASMGDQPEWSQLCHISAAHPDTRQNRNVCCHLRLGAANTFQLHQGAMMLREPQPCMSAAASLFQRLWAASVESLGAFYWILSTESKSETTNSSMCIKLVFKIKIYQLIRAQAETFMLEHKDRTSFTRCDHTVKWWPFLRMPTVKS